METGVDECIGLLSPVEIWIGDTKRLLGSRNRPLALQCLQIAKWNSPYQITSTIRHNPDTRAPRNALALRA